MKGLDSPFYLFGHAFLHHCSKSAVPQPFLETLNTQIEQDGEGAAFKWALLVGAEAALGHAGATGIGFNQENTGATLPKHSDRWTRWWRMVTLGEQQPRSACWFPGPLLCLESFQAVAWSGSRAQWSVERCMKRYPCSTPENPWIWPCWQEEP